MNIIVADREEKIKVLSKNVKVLSKNVAVLSKNNAAKDKNIAALHDENAELRRILQQAGISLPS